MKTKFFFEISYDKNPNWTKLIFVKESPDVFSGYFIGQSFVPFPERYDGYTRKIYGVVKNLVVHDGEGILKVTIRADSIETEYLEGKFIKEKTGKESVAESIKSLFEKYGWNLLEEK